MRRIGFCHCPAFILELSASPSYSRVNVVLWASANEDPLGWISAYIGSYRGGVATPTRTGGHVGECSFLCDIFFLPTRFGYVLDCSRSITLRTPNPGWRFTLPSRTTGAPARTSPPQLNAVGYPGHAQGWAQMAGLAPDGHEDCFY